MGGWGTARQASEKLTTASTVLKMSRALSSSTASDRLCIRSSKVSALLTTSSSLSMTWRLVRSSPTISILFRAQGLSLTLFMVAMKSNSCSAGPGDPFPDSDAAPPSPIPSSRPPSLILPSPATSLSLSPPALQRRTALFLKKTRTFPGGNFSQGRALRISPLQLEALECRKRVVRNHPSKDRWRRNERSRGRGQRPIESSRKEHNPRGG